MTGSTFDLDRCSECSYVFVRDPRTDFASLYDEGYYRGHGADKSVSYFTEMADPATIRLYEWRGVVRAVEQIAPVVPETRWLDYGCGLGGLVRWVRENHECAILGFEEGYAAEQLIATGIPSITRTELEAAAGTFDVVTAIEVLEHAIDPVGVLEEIRTSLRPGGVLFLTTGNAEPFRDRLAKWSYTAVPDVHVGFFEPLTLAAAMQRAGLEPIMPGYLSGHEDIIRFKVLKSLRAQRRHVAERIVPWSLVARVVDRRHRVSAMPAARRV